MEGGKWDRRVMLWEKGRCIMGKKEEGEERKRWRGSRRLLKGEGDGGGGGVVDGNSKGRRREAGRTGNKMEVASIFFPCT